MGRAGVWVACALLAGCLGRPSPGEGDGGADGDGAPDGCERVFFDGFEDGALDVGAWSDEDSTVAPQIGGGFVLFESEGDLDGQATSEIWSREAFPIDQLTVTIDQVVPQIEAEGTLLFELGEPGGMFYSFYAAGGELRVFDNSLAVCDPECPALVQDQPQRWRFRPAGGELSFEIALDGEWQVIDTAPLRATPSRVLLHAATGGAGDYASLRVGSISLAACGEPAL